MLDSRFRPGWAKIELLGGQWKGARGDPRDFYPRAATSRSLPSNRFWVGAADLEVCPQIDRFRAILSRYREARHPVFRDPCHLRLGFACKRFLVSPKRLLRPSRIFDQNEEVPNVVFEFSPRFLFSLIFDVLK